MLGYHRVTLPDADALADLLVLQYKRGDGTTLQISLRQ